MRLQENIHRIKEIMGVKNNMIGESYDSNQLYLKKEVISKLLSAPKEIKKYIDNLPDIECEDEQGNRDICTKIPEVLYVYFKGDY